MINETNSWLFKKINQIDELLARLMRERARAQVNHIRNSKEITTDITIIQRFIRNYCENIYSDKIDKIGEMDNHTQWNFEK